VPTDDELKLALTFIDDLSLHDSVLLLSHSPASAASALLARLPASAAAARMTVMAQRHPAGVVVPAANDPPGGRELLLTRCAALESLTSPRQLHDAVAALARTAKTQLGVSLTLAMTLPLPAVPPAEGEKEVVVRASCPAMLRSARVIETPLRS
jgi:hypothetical protein